MNLKGFRKPSFFFPSAFFFLFAPSDMPNLVAESRQFRLWVLVYFWGDGKDKVSVNSRELILLIPLRISNLNLG